MRPRCPTCGAGFRGEPACGRCGTDLRPLAAVVLSARREREEARRFLIAGEGEEALRRAIRSRELQDAPEGRRLHALALLAAGRLRDGIRLAAAEVEAEEE